VLGNAESRAKAIVKEAEKKSASLMKDAEQRLAQIRVEREAVAGYIANLRGVLDSADRVSADHGFPAAAPDEPVKAGALPAAASESEPEAAAAASKPDTSADASADDDALDEETREREHAN
jgi:hypothetical protein